MCECARVNRRRTPPLPPPPHQHEFAIFSSLLALSRREGSVAGSTAAVRRCQSLGSFRFFPPLFLPLPPPIHAQTSSSPLPKPVSSQHTADTVVAPLETALNTSTTLPSPFHPPLPLPRLLSRNILPSLNIGPLASTWAQTGVRRTAMGAVYLRGILQRTPTFSEET